MLKSRASIKRQKKKESKKMDELNDIKKGCAKVHLNDGSFAQVPFDELSQFLIDNEHLTNNTQRCLRKRVASFAKKMDLQKKTQF